MSVHRKVVVNLFASAWSALLGLLLLPVYLRYVGVEAYGLVGFFVTLQAWVLLLDMGITPTINREIARFGAGAYGPQRIRDLFRSVELVYAGVAIALALAVAGAAEWIATDWLNLKALSPAAATHAIIVMGLVIATQWQATLYRSAVLGLQEQLWLGGVTIAMATIRALLTLAVLAWIDPTIVAFLATQCAVSACEALLLAHRVHDRLPAPPRPARFSLQALREVWRFAAGMTVITVLATILTQADKLLLSRLLSLEQFGYFSLAIAVTSALGTLISPVDNVAYPRLTELVAAGRTEALVAEYHRFAQLLAIMLLPAALVLSVFSHEIMLAWTQDPVTARSVAPLLSVWVLGTALNGLMHVPYAAQLAHGWPRLTIGVNAVAVALMVPSILFWVPRHGAIAAAWIWTLLNLGYTVFNVGLMHRRILRTEKWNWYLKDVCWPLAAGVLATTAMAAVHRQVGPFGRTGEVAFLAGTVLLVTAAVLPATAAGQAILRAALASMRGAKVTNHS